ncbi:hypothetical protein G9U51_08545 [Calidifontibacter sp. DB0510]|uniref:Uncharacterized protein n=1 Tax=Metallococcus carri TaxID=1656884 RepID=A0A967B0I0_9MICO|nr:hypothetical protein [Metallococcus carri]NHN55822.1 hypothetical protein [Metallococcus carri]NOP38490.1 hypothetical protein [Calidifontibacter sp. DB2511S]
MHAFRPFTYWRRRTRHHTAAPPPVPPSLTATPSFDTSAAYLLGGRVPPRSFDTPPAGIAGRRDPDHRASYRVLLVAARLRRGDDPARVAASTGVPLALVELIADELATRAGDDSTRKPSAHPRPQRRRRRRKTFIAAVIALEAVAIGNIVATITAALHHVPALAALTGVLSILLILSVWALARSITPPPPATDPYGRGGSANLDGLDQARGRNERPNPDPPRDDAGSP